MLEMSGSCGSRWVGEEAVKFTGPVVGEIVSELFNGVGVYFEMKQIDEVFIELHDGGVTSCELVSGSRYAAGAVELYNESFRETLDDGKVEDGDCIGLDETGRELFIYLH